MFNLEYSSTYSLHSRTVSYRTMEMRIITLQMGKLGLRDVRSLLKGTVSRRIAKLQTQVCLTQSRYKF